MKTLSVLSVLFVLFFSFQSAAQLDTINHMHPVSLYGKFCESEYRMKTYTIHWPADLHAYYGQMSVRSDSTGKWVDNWRINIASQTVWNYDSCFVTVYDRFSYIDSTWQYRIVLW